MIKKISHSIFFICLSLLLMGGSIYGKNCLEGCTFSEIIDGDTVSFNYRLVPAIPQSITYVNGNYLVKIEKKSEKLLDVHGKIELTDLSGNKILFFSRDRTKGNFLQLKMQQLKLIPNNNRSAPFKFEFQVNNTIGKIPFLIGNSNNGNIKGTKGEYTLNFNFIIINDNTKEITDNKNEAEIINDKIDDGKQHENNNTIPPSNNIGSVTNKVNPTRKNENVGSNPIKINADEKPRIKPPIRKPEKTQEEKDWRKAGKLNSHQGYRAFGKKYKNSRRYGDRLKKRLALTGEMRREKIIPINSGYEIEFINAFKLVATYDTVEYRGLEIETIVKDSAGHYSNILIVTNLKKNIELQITDLEKPNSINSTSLKLGNHLDPVEYIKENKIDSIKFQKGDPPYYIHFFQDGIRKDTRKIEESNIWIPEENYFKSKNIYGELIFRISDKNKMMISNDKWKINIPKPSNWETYWLVGVLVVLLGLFFIYPKIRQSKRNKRKQNFKKQRSDEWESHINELSLQKEKLKPVDEPDKIIEEGGNEYEGKAKPEMTNAQKNSKIKIINIKKATSEANENIDEKELDQFLKKEIHFKFDTTIFWSDTRVSMVYFTEKSISKLDQFLKEQNLRPLKEQEGQIPEIGGILLGRPFLSKKQNVYRVLVEEFVPIAPEYHDKYQLEFSAQSMAKDLGEMQEQFPDLLLVGWFHTHPGHGLFLSRPDLRIHETFFKRPYQFAMEIDSLTDRLDTGFFTRMKDGKINNRRNLIQNTPWYSWLEAEAIE